MNLLKYSFVFFTFWKAKEISSNDDDKRWGIAETGRFGNMFATFPHRDVPRKGRSKLPQRVVNRSEFRIFRRESAESASDLMVTTTSGGCKEGTGSRERDENFGEKVLETTTPNGNENRDFTRCEECDITFRYDTLYRNHCEYVHGKPPEYPCVCGKLYGRRGDVRKHFDKRHAATSGGNPYYKRFSRLKDIFCYVCRRNFKGWKCFEQHAHSAHKDIKMIPCEHCELKFFCSKTLAKHARLKHADSVLTCKICKNTFNQSDVLKRHVEFCERRQLNKRRGSIVKTAITPNMKTVHIRCDECRDIFESFALLRDHYKNVHPDVRLNPCEFCEKTFADKQCLDRHVDMQHADRYEDVGPFMKYSKGLVYACRHCGIDIVGLAAYQKHAKEHPRMPMFYCKQCGKGYSYYKNLKAHANKQHGGYEGVAKRTPKMEKGSYYCEVCRKSFFVNKVSFRKHVKRHDAYDVCHVCLRGFRRDDSNGLDQHMRCQHPGNLENVSENEKEGDFKKCPRENEENVRRD